MVCRLQSYQSIAIYNDPAHAQVGCVAFEDTKLPLFTLFPPLPNPSVVCRPQTYQSLEIYNDPAPVQVGCVALKVIAITMIQPLPR